MKNENNYIEIYENICDSKMIKMSNTLIEYPLFSFNRRERTKKREFKFEVDIRNREYEFEISEDEIGNSKLKQINEWCNEADIRIEKIVVETVGERIAASKEFNLILALIEIWQDQTIESDAFNFTLGNICRTMGIKNEYRNRQTVYNSLFNLQSFMFKIKSYYYKGTGTNKELIGSTANKIYDYRGKRFEMYDDLYESRKELSEDEREQINKTVLKNISRNMILESNIIQLPYFIQEDIQGKNNTYINLTILNKLKTDTEKKLYMLLTKRGYKKSEYKVSISKLYDRIPIAKKRRYKIVEILNSLVKQGAIKDYDINENDILTVKYYMSKDIEKIRNMYQTSKEIENKHDIYEYIENLLSKKDRAKEENIIYAYLVASVEISKKVAKDLILKHKTRDILKTIYFYKNYKRIYIQHQIMGFEDELYTYDAKNVVYHIKTNNKELNINRLMMMDSILQKFASDQPILHSVKESIDKNISEKEFEKILCIYLSNTMEIRTIESMKENLAYLLGEYKKETI